MNRILCATIHWVSFLRFILLFSVWISVENDFWMSGVSRLLVYSKAIFMTSKSIYIDSMSMLSGWWWSSSERYGQPLKSPIKQFAESTKWIIQLNLSFRMNISKYSFEMCLHLSKWSFNLCFQAFISNFYFHSFLVTSRFNQNTDETIFIHYIT